MGGDQGSLLDMNESDPTVPVTMILVLVTGLSSFLGFRTPALVDRYLLDSQRILRRNEYWRTVTSAFFHADLGHLFFNLFSLYSFAQGIELIYGPGTLLVIYFSSVLGGSLLSLWIHRREEYRALGASGGVCGVIYAAIFLLPGSSVYIFFIPIPIPAAVYAILFLVISIWGIRSRFGNIGHDAHVGGALVGLVVTTFLYPEVILAQPLLFLVVTSISVGLMLWLIRRDKAR